MTVKKKASVKKKSAPKKKVVAKKKVAVKKTSKKKAAKPSKAVLDVDMRYKAFALEYIIDFNATRAAIACGYSKKTANQQGSRLLAHAKVQGFIAEAMGNRSKRTGIDADFVLSELGNMAKADPLDIINPDTLGFKPITDWPLSWRRMLSALDVSEIMEHEGDVKVKIGDMVKMKFPDRLRILEVLGKHVDVQAFLNKIEVNDNTVLADRLRRSRERAQGQHGGS